jgi:hypothetical protein
VPPAPAADGNSFDIGLDHLKPGGSIHPDVRGVNQGSRAAMRLGFARRPARSLTRSHTPGSGSYMISFRHLVRSPERQSKTEKRGMAKNIDRVLRIVDAAVALIQIEAAWNAGKGGRGSQAAKRELKAAYEDYMSHHAADVK